MDGPASEIVLPDPMNRPVPIVPPMAMSCRCRLDRLRARWGSSPCLFSTAGFDAIFIKCLHTFGAPLHVNVGDPQPPAPIAGDIAKGMHRRWPLVSYIPAYAVGEER